MSMPTTRVGMIVPEVGRKVEVAGADQRIEQLRAHRSDRRLQPGDLAGREHPRQQAAMDRVRGRILEDQRARREHDARFEQVECHASTRDERLPIDVGALDVVEAAQRVEVVLLVVVERRFVTDPTEEGMRVVPDLLGVGVVLQVRGVLGGRHRLPLSPVVHRFAEIYRRWQSSVRSCGPGQWRAVPCVDEGDFVERAAGRGPEDVSRFAESDRQEAPLILLRGAAEDHPNGAATIRAA